MDEKDVVAQVYTGNHIEGFNFKFKLEALYLDRHSNWILILDRNEQSFCARVHNLIPELFIHEYLI